MKVLSCLRWERMTSRQWPGGMVRGTDGMLVPDPFVEPREEAERAEDERRREERARVEACADGEADARDDPEARRRREARDGHAFLHDGAGAEEADAGDDLRREACGVGIRMAFDAQVEFLREHHDEAGAEAHEEVRPEARRLSSRLAFVADDAAEHAREHEAQQELFVADGRHGRTSPFPYKHHYTTE